MWRGGRGRRGGPDVELGCRNEALLQILSRQGGGGERGHEGGDSSRGKEFAK